MSIYKKIGYILASLLACLVVGDILGVAACFFGDLLFPRSWSIGAVYAVWFVLGVFIGIIHYPSAGDLCTPGSSSDWTTRAGASLNGALVIGVSIAFMLALLFVFERVSWSRGAVSHDGYVPDSKSATMTLFVTIVAAMFFARWVSQQEGPSKKTKHKNKRG